LAFSFVAGYGDNAMLHPHHRFWGNQPENGYPPPPPGALAGGPNGQPSDPAALDAGLMDLGPAKRYIDQLESYSTNEVAINWNAPLVWVTAYLDQQYGESR
jgi:endoglucanase